MLAVLSGGAFLLAGLLLIGVIFYVVKTLADDEDY